MTVTIEVPADIEASLAAKAEALGLPLPEYVTNLLRKSILTPEERAAAWRESAKNLPPTPTLSDEAMSRDAIYSDHD
jgi:hypothetical protein